MDISPIHQPHDAHFNQALRDIRVAQEFLAQHLPQDIQAAMDKKSLCLRDGTFIDEHLRKQYTDVLYSATFKGDTGYIYLLIEHQSSADKTMPWRLLQYTVKIMAQHLKTHKTDKLPLVIPIVLYHGQQKYPYGTDVRDLVAAPKALVDQYFLKHFRLIDLNTIEDKELRKYLWGGLVQFVHKHIRARDYLILMRQALEWHQTVEQQDGENLNESLLYYISKVSKLSDWDTFKVLIQQTLPNSGEKVMNAFEQYATEARNEGIEQGMEKGIEKEKFTMAKRMLDSGTSLDYVADITDLPLSTLRALQEDAEVVA